MKRVLLVDDARFMRNILKRILVKNGYEVVGEASDGDEGVELYKQLKPDLVTLDITMETMNGIEALKEIRKFDKDARAIMCSAMGQPYLIIDSLQNGAKDFIVKPFSEEKVLLAVTKALE